MIVAIPQCQEFTPHFTVAELVDMPADLPTGPVQYELYDGRLMARPPRGDVYYSVNLSFPGALLFDAEQRGLGVARCGEVRLILWRQPDRVVLADAVFFANRSLPLRTSHEGCLETVPDLVVEIMSKNDELAYMKTKVEDYLIAGAQLVWVADPTDQTVTAFRQQAEPKIFSESDLLKADGVLPGLRMPVREVFVNQLTIRN
jgi:Uma2 family endonuclease